MPVRVACPNPDCGTVANVEEQSLGRRGRCKSCGQVFVLVRPGVVDASSASGATSAWNNPAPAGPTNMPEQFGRYRIMKALGQGGMGAVYLAQDTKLGRPVALKVPFFHPSDGPQAIQRFDREARAAATLNHPSLCPVYDVGEVDGIHYLTMPYIEGKPLSDLLKETRAVFSESRAAALVRKLALALRQAHEKGVVHRDLKPANIMVKRARDLVIMDFGLARMAVGDEGPITQTGHVLGTALYMAPEQAAGDVAATGPASDVYSLGVILYELLTGRRPFEGTWSLVIGLKNLKDPDPPSAHRPGLDTRLNAICLKAIARSPEDRYATMAEFAEALTTFLNQATAPASADPRSDDPTRSLAAQVFAGLADAEATSLRPGKSTPRPRGRAWIAVVVAGVTALLLLVGTVLVARRGDDPAPIVRLEPVSVKPPEPPRPAPTPPDDPQPSAPLPSPKVDAARITNTLGLTLAMIPAGEFAMGSDDTDPDADHDEKVDGSTHRVRITRAFSLGTTEVTVGQFRRFIEQTGYLTDAEKDGWGGYGWDEEKGNVEQSTGYTWRSPGFPQTEDHPVVNVSWNDAVAFCKWLSGEDGRTYRLPTEAEWEYACRAGTTTRFFSGDDLESLAKVGNVPDESAAATFPDWTGAIKANDGHLFTAPVGRYPSNKFGLFDMHGNVWEWCADWFDRGYYAKSPPSDPQNTAPTQDRVHRGGGWNLDPRSCRSADRYGGDPISRYFSLGFRVARDL